MEIPRVRCVLVVADGPSRRVGRNGIMIGRQEDCDIVAGHPKLSRRHALVRLTQLGAEIIPVGRQAVEVNRKRHERPHALRDGDTITLPGLRLRVELAVEKRDPSAASSYRLVRAKGDSFGVSHSPFVIGGDLADDLIVKSWPAHALALRLAQGQLFVEVNAGKAMRNDAEIGTGALEPLAAGDTLDYRDERFVISQPTTHGMATTDLGADTELPRRVTIEVLPRGGRVVFSTGDIDRTVFLHDRRLDLIVALLRPPGTYRPGDFIPDEVVGSIVWPRSPASRVEINILIARCRKDLVEAGLAGPRLLQRAPTGGATRLALAPDATVVLQR